MARLTMRISRSKRSPIGRGHRVFMNALESEGLARLAGPLEGTNEVLLVFRAETAEEIERRLADDPWTQSGILSTTRILGWNVRLGEVS